MQLYGLKNCDTCRKALKSLADAELVDVRDKGVPENVLMTAISLFGAKLVNTRSTTWRNLAESERARPPAELLKAYPTLMKRPLIALPDGQLLLGWGADSRAALGVG